ncbi:MAG: hypothetical protein H6841_10580 [Planctomycetes bacterium]|nr:hypothetical protein [Planctomycetota bacterium]MCB9936599.1 hypothetical protein [Planctomycetota bacterium]
MLKTIVLLLAFAIASPLAAGGLVEKVFLRKVADDWHAHFRTWVNDECKAGRCPETYFPDGAGARPYRIMEVKNDALVAAELRETNDGKGNLTRTPAVERVQFKWEQWLPRYMAVTYPVRSNEDNPDVIAFACWLYLNAPDPMLGNRVLTVVYEREESLREDIAEFVCERHGWALKDKLAVGEEWDAEFMSWRRVLLPKKEAEQREKQRKAEAKEGLSVPLAQYAAPDKRTMTLDEIAYALRQWLAKFGDSDAKQKAEADKALQRIADDLENVATFVELAANTPDTQPEKQAKFHEDALKLDPCSADLLARAADAWRRHANPEVVGAEFKCTQEHSARRALELYQRWLLREPGNFKVLINIGVCHHVIGERDAARKAYKRVIEESGDDKLAKQAREYDNLR